MMLHPYALSHSQHAECGIEWHARLYNKLLPSPPNLLHYISLSPLEHQQPKTILRFGVACIVFPRQPAYIHLYFRLSQPKTCWLYSLTFVLYWSHHRLIMPDLSLHFTTSHFPLEFYCFYQKALSALLAFGMKGSCWTSAHNEEVWSFLNANLQISIFVPIGSWKRVASLSHRRTRTYKPTCEPPDHSWRTLHLLPTVSPRLFVYIPMSQSTRMWYRSDFLLVYMRWRHQLLRSTISKTLWHFLPPNGRPTTFFLFCTLISIRAHGTYAWCFLGGNVTWVGIQSPE